MLANSVILSKIRAMGLLLSVMERSARPAKSQADTCGSSRQHDTAGGERQTAAHTRTEACCVRQQSKAVIGCDRRAVIRCTRINKFWSDPAQQTDAQKCTRTHTLIHTPHWDGAATAGPPSETWLENCVCVCVCRICVCLSVSVHTVCYVSFIIEKRILLNFNIKNGKKRAWAIVRYRQKGRNGKIIASAAPIIT